MKKITFRIKTLSIILFSASVMLACGKKEEEKKSPSNSTPPIPQASVVTVTPQDITISTELPGRLEATRIAQVRARIAGVVLKRTYTEGSDVKQGQIIFKIDDAPLKAIYNSTQASLTKAKTNLEQANLKLQRYKPLVENNAISKQEYDDVLSTQKQALADVAIAKSNQETARLNLSYATVTAPISGRIGKALVTEGALVGQGEATPMALIQQINPIYVTFTQSTSQINQLKQALNSNNLKQVPKQATQLTLINEDGSIYKQQGKLLFSEMLVDEGTGTVSLRAEFPNSDKSLLPGMYVKVKLNQGVRSQAIAIPQQAVMRGLDNSSVLVVQSDGKVASKIVKTNGVENGKWIISEGLNIGDKVIVEGLNKIKAGATVTPIEFNSGENIATDNVNTNSTNKSTTNKD